MTRLRIGIIGCGAIGQIQYLPLLRDLPEHFEVAAISDLSRAIMTKLGETYGIPPERQFTDYNELIASDVDCVVVCNTTSYHADPAIAAARAGKHVLIEKPMCTTVNEAERIAAAVAESGVVAMVGYMKQHDPAFLHARDLVEEMRDIRLVEVEHLHPDNSLHLKRFPLVKPTDLDPSVRDAMSRDERKLTAEALGVEPDRLSPGAHQAFFWVLNSMIHDISNLSGLFGPPQRVVSSGIWADGNCVTCTLEYAAGFRAIATWVDLPALQTFRETLEVYGSAERVIVSFPTGFSIGLPTEVDHHGMDADAKPWVERRTWQENPFRLELLQFHTSITTGAPVITPVATAVHDIRLAGDIVKAAMRSEGFHHAN